MRMSEDQERRKLYAEGQEIIELHTSGKCGRRRLADCDCHRRYNAKLKRYRSLEGSFFEPNRLARSAPAIPGEKRGRREGRS